MPDELPVTDPTPLATRKMEIEADPDFLSGHRSPARHVALVAEWNRIFRALHPEPTPMEPS